MRSSFAGFLSGTAVSALCLAGASALVTLTEVRPDQPELIAETADIDTAPDEAQSSAMDAPEPELLAEAPGVPESDESPSTSFAAKEAEKDPDPASSVARLDSPDALSPADADVPVADAVRQPDVASSDLGSIEPQTPYAEEVFDARPDASLSTPAPSAPVALRDGDRAVAPDTIPDVAPSDGATPERVDTPTRSDDVASEDVTPGEPISDGLITTLADTPEDVTAGTIGDLAQDVTTNRLPVVGEPAPVEAPDASVTSESIDDALPPLERHAVAFENTDGKPLMSIVLVDDGTLAFGPELLAEFPYPLSFAIDVTRSDAAAVAAQYEQAGYEVLALTNLPTGANAQDTEVAMATYLQAIPQAIAIFEGGGTGLQSNLEASKQLGDILRDSGHGLILRPNGLNTAQKQISDKGVPAITFLRDIDAAGEDARTLRRGLDQAVFRAGQGQDSIIMVGRLRAETINALALWSIEDRASGVAIAPVSAALMALSRAEEETGGEEG